MGAIAKSLSSNLWTNLITAQDIFSKSSCEQKIEKECTRRKYGQRNNWKIVWNFWQNLPINTHHRQVNVHIMELVDKFPKLRHYFQTRYGNIVRYPDLQWLPLYLFWLRKCWAYLAEEIVTAVPKNQAEQYGAILASFQVNRANKP